MSSSQFVLMLHNAIRAGKHHDLRIKMPNSNMWASFAFRKEIPKTTKSKKILLFRTNDHTEAEARFTGKISSGYGAGTIKQIDGGSCNIILWKPEKIMIVDFNGRILKGKYCFLVIDKKNKNQYLFFKKGK